MMTVAATTPVAANPAAASTGETETPAAVPAHDEILAALRAGYRAIDDGEGFYPGFNGWLESLGYRRQPDWPCTCPDGGYRGHLPECRWVRS